MKNITQPVVITDKNGRITTVHRKVEKASSQASFPVPVASKAGPVRSSLESKWKELLDWHSWGQELFDQSVKVVKSLSDEDLRNLVGIVDADMPISGDVITRIIEGVSVRRGEKRSRWLRRMKENHLDRWEEYCAEVKEVQKEKYVRPDVRSATDWTMKAVDGVEFYASRGFELTPDQEANLISLTSSIYLQSMFNPNIGEMLDSDEDHLGREENFRVASDDLVQYIVDYPEELETIRGYIKDPRVTREAEVLELLRGGGSSSLTSGVL